MKRSRIHPVQQILFEGESVTQKNMGNERKRTEDNYAFDIIDALTAPILTFSHNWADTIPKRLMNLVPMARMISLMKRESLASQLECVIYIYTRTLEAPMDSEWVDIYIHVSCKTLEQWFQEDHWKAVKAPRELSDWLQSKLDRLRRHIYDKRREILKRHIKEDKKSEERDSITIVSPPISKQSIVQTTFNF